MNFLERALPMIDRGIPVMPLRNNSKVPFLQNWETLASTDFFTVAEWSEQFSEANCASVATLEGVWIFEVDSADVIKRFEAETGQKLPETFQVESSPNHHHFYWKSTDASRRMSNIAQGFVKNADWSARHDRQFCVSPLSIHPKTGLPYKVVSDAAIIEAPDFLISWCLSQKITPASKPVGIEGDRVARGAHDTTLTAIAGKLRNDGMEEESINDALIEIIEKRFDDYGSDYRLMAGKVAHSVCRYPVGPAYTVTMGGKLPGQSVTANKTAGSESDAGATAGKRNLTTRTADKIKTKKIKWLWDFRIPAGKLSVFAGNPDQGKSLVTMYMVSQLTTGRALYLSNPLQPCEVLLLCGEDEADDTIVPRLQAGGADLSRVHIVESIAVTDGEGLTIEEREAQLDTDIKAIETKLVDYPGIRLVVIDPLSNYLGSANMNREQEVRQVLIPLKALAARTGVAVVSVMHLNKTTDTSAIHRVGGAVAFTGIARAAWLFTEDPEDKDKHLMLRIKGNIAKSTQGLVYRILAKPVQVEGEAMQQPYIEFEGETQLDTGVLMAGRMVGRPDSQMQTAKEWLAEFLADGSQTTADIESFGKKAGHSFRTLERAKEELGAYAAKIGRRWEWSLMRENNPDERIDFGDEPVSSPPH
jgi:putative DNA primase/helicase